MFAHSLGPECLHIAADLRVCTRLSGRSRPIVCVRFHFVFSRGRTSGVRRFSGERADIFFLVPWGCWSRRLPFAMGLPVFQPEPGNFMKTAPLSTRPVMSHIVCGNLAVSIDTEVWLVNEGGP